MTDRQVKCLDCEHVFTVSDLAQNHAFYCPKCCGTVLIMGIT